MCDRRIGAALVIVVGRREDGLGCVRHRSVILVAQFDGSDLVILPAATGSLAHRSKDRENVTVPM
jgi:hypothetical protein